MMLSLTFIKEFEWGQTNDHSQLRELFEEEHFSKTKFCKLMLLVLWI
jgi:hypothetical protein